MHALYLETAYLYTHTSTCPLRPHGPPYSLHSHPRVPVAELVSLTALAEPLSQLVITTLPPHSPLVLSCCALTICGNWLGPKRHVTPTTGDPKMRTLKHSQDPEDTHIHTQCTAVTVVAAIRCGSEESRKGCLLCIWTHADKVGANGRNVPGRKYTDVRDFKNQHWECLVR